MAVHVVCLDGTGQVKVQLCPTNIALLFDALGGAETDGGDGSLERSGAQATGKYLPGVGTSGRIALRALGNLFGDGIAEPIIRGYTYLSRVYQPGDRVIVIGFSRGATAARALAGWLAVRGPLDPSKYDPENKEQAYQRAIAAWYFYRKGKPDLAHQARLRLLAEWLGQMPKISAVDFVGPITVDAVGVFDTVSSLGLPRLDASGVPVFDFSLCDTELNPRVTHGIHALAVDETRDLFAPTFWASRGDIVQQLFPGSHSDVGGGYPEHGLSDAALVWMTARLNAVQPVFDLTRLKRQLAPDALAPAHDEARVFPFFATPSRARAFPHIAEPSKELRDRHGHPTATLPGSMSKAYRPAGRFADGSDLLA